MHTTGFIGTGNMAGAIIRGIAANSSLPIVISDHDQDKCDALKQAFPTIRIANNNTELVQQSQIVVLGVKPVHMQALLSEIAPCLQAQCLVSIAAGVSTKTIRQITGSCCEIIRAMPNTPALLGKGITGIYANQADSKYMPTVELLFNAVGKTLWLKDEDLLHAVTALSGSGPAYFFYLMEALLESATELGLEPDQAALLIKETALGASALAASTNESLSLLRRQVTSPGGTTEAAITTFDAQNVKTGLQTGLRAAYKRSIELS